MTERSLHRKLAEVQGALQTVTKTGYNSHFKYNYVTEADLLDAVRPLMSQRHLSFVIGDSGMPDLSYSETVDKYGKPKVMLRALIPMEMIITDGDTGETITVRGCGYAQSEDDKAIYKAKTGGAKYLLYKAFGISTGEEPEADDGLGQNEEGEAAPAAANNGTTRKKAASKPAANDDW